MSARRVLRGSLDLRSPACGPVESGVPRWGRSLVTGDGTNPSRLQTGDQLRELLVAEFEAARMRTLGLLAPLSDEELERQPSPIMSPLVWDLAHIGYFEELWLLRRLDDDGPQPRRRLRGIQPATVASGSLA